MNDERGDVLYAERQTTTQSHYCISLTLMRNTVVSAKFIFPNIGKGSQGDGEQERLTEAGFKASIRCSKLPNHFSEDNEGRSQQWRWGEDNHDDSG